MAVPSLVLTAILAVMTAWTAGSGDAGTLEIAPDLVTAVIVAGLGYPVGFGGVGGALAAATSS